MLVVADKNTNLYDILRNHYEKFLHDNATQIYKKAITKTKSNMKNESNKFAKSVDLDERMECYSDQIEFITLKEHNQNTVTEKSSVSQWRNTEKI